MVIQGTAAPALLASYSTERSAVGDSVLRKATLLTNMATLSNRAAQTTRDIALRMLLGISGIQHHLAATMGEIDIAYSASPLSIGRKAGTRLAPEKNGGSPPGAGNSPRFVLYAPDARRGSSLTARFSRLLEARPRAVTNAHELLLVRPDGYIGFAGGRDDWDEATAYLSRLSIQ
jgi:hypothetical protein